MGLGPWDGAVFCYDEVFEEVRDEFCFCVAEVVVSEDGILLFLG